MATMHRHTDPTRDSEHYREGRPPYPRSLAEIIYSYHRTHAPATTTAPTPVALTHLVDLGAGSGTATRIFMPKLTTIHIANPISAKLSAAQTSLAAWRAQHSLPTALSFHEVSVEDTPGRVGAGTADLVVCATAPHFVDPDVLVRCMAEVLRPGGTLAVFTYWMPVFPGRSRALHEAFAGVWDRLVIETLMGTQDARVPVAETALARIIRRRIAGRGGLDFLPLGGEGLRDPVRVYINAGEGEELPYREIFERFEPVGWRADELSRVSGGDRVVNYQTGEDAEAEGWLFEVDKKWLPSFVDTIHPSREKMSEEETRKAYAEWDKAFDEECPDGVLHVLWPAYLAMATKR